MQDRLAKTEASLSSVTLPIRNVCWSKEVAGLLKQLIRSGKLGILGWSEDCHVNGSHWAPLESGLPGDNGHSSTAFRTS